MATNNSQIAAKKWEDAQEKAFTNWVNTLLAKVGEKIESVTTDFASGVKLIHFLELLSNKKCKRKYNADPKDKINKIQNLHIGLSFLEDDLMLKARGVGAEDFYDGNKKMILGFLWNVYRRYRISMIAAQEQQQADKDPSEKEAEDTLLRWCSNMAGMNVGQFKSGFKDGMAFLAMAQQFSSPDDTSLLNLDLGSGVDSIARLNAVFDFAEKHLNIPKLLDADELANGSADERTVMLYTSLFYNVYESRKKVQKSEHDELTEKIMEQAEIEKHSISKLMRLEEELNMYNEELRMERLQRFALEKIYREEQEKNLQNNLYLLRDTLEEHQINLCKLQQMVQESATGKKALLWTPTSYTTDYTQSQIEQLKTLESLLDDETKRINTIVQFSNAKPISFLKQQQQQQDQQQQQQQQQHTSSQQQE
ncbi:actin bundling protein [Tieghemostelium lacteum]|uniref:Actin bundling protein n=1 Tax=Tieghemostelium lacteum TaxID=361077 RepID=A0A151ZJZ9_TIELA|nr:actin bundling protein [Tieghemostelium lacteum]|eukprot:KYQ94229.1 actin bundling protein [Tieghemostelium lacteum]